MRLIYKSKAILNGSQLRYQDATVQSVVLHIGQQQGRYTLSGDAKNIRQGDTSLSLVNFDGNGTLDNHSLHVSTAHPQGKLDAICKAVGSRGNGLVLLSN